MEKVLVSRANVLARIRKQLKRQGRGRRFLKASTPEIETQMGARWLIVEGAEVVGFADTLDSAAVCLDVLEDFEQMEYAAKDLERIFAL